MQTDDYPQTIEWRGKTVRLFVDPRLGDRAAQLLDGATQAILRADDAGGLYDAMVNVANENDVELAAFVDGPDHFHPYDDWITVAFRPAWTWGDGDLDEGL